MKKSLRSKVETIRNKVVDLMQDLDERKDELLDRDDPEGKYEEEIEEIDELMYLLEQMDNDLYDYE